MGPLSPFRHSSFRHFQDINRRSRIRRKGGIHVDNQFASAVMEHLVVGGV